MTRLKIFKLSVGDYWNYVKYEEVYSDTGELTFSDTSTIHIEVVEYVILSGDSAAKVLMRLDTGTIEYEYGKITDIGFLDVRYETPGATGFYFAPKFAPTYYDEPRIFLKFPVIIDDQWNLSSGSSFDITRKVIGQEEVTTPARVFDCYKIQHIVSISPETNIYLWYNVKVGVIKKTVADLNTPRNFYITILLTDHSTANE